MAKNFTNQALTPREFEIMQILWESEASLTASEIVAHGKKLSINTVQAVLKKLLKQNLIKVDQIVYSGTVLSRSYKPILSEKDFEMNHLLSAFHKLSEGGGLTSNFVSCLIDQEGDSRKALHEIEELEAMLNRKKQKLQEK